MDKNEKNYILRSIYLEPQQDELLRKVAFKHKISKAKLIRMLISMGLEHLEEDWGELKEE